MVALVLALALALLVASYVSLSVGALRSSDRSFHLNTAFNLAEAGLEEALWALNNDDWTRSGWTGSGSTRVRTGSFSTPDLAAANNASGYFNVYVTNIETGAPTVIAEGVVRPVTGALIRKQLRISARSANLFMPPFTAITDLTLNGGEIDSYRMAEGDYTTAPKRYETTVASPSVTIGDITIGSPADIYGYVTVGLDTSQSTAFVNSFKGTVQGGPTTTIAGAPGVLGTSSKDFIDTNRIAYDFVQDFPPPDAPTGAFTDPFPSPDANNIIVLGDYTGATTKRYQLTNYSVPNKTTLLIVGPVEIKALGDLAAAGQAAITVLNGSASITPSKGATITYSSTNASLKLYAYGDLTISGNGAMVGGTNPDGSAKNSTDPTKFLVYGMSTTSQAFDIGGNGNLAAAVYAPRANMKFNGGGSSGYFAGATVANNITVNGNGYRIRFPEEMADMNTASTYQISRWMELTDRSTWHNFGTN